MYMDEGKGPRCRVVMIVLLWSRRCGLSHRGVIVASLLCCGCCIIVLSRRCHLWS